MLELTMKDTLIKFLEEPVRLERVPFDRTEEDFAEVQRGEKTMDDDLHDV